MSVIARTCPECKGEGLQTGDGGGEDGGGNYHHPPCSTCDDRGEVVPADFYRGAVDLLRELVKYPGLIGAALPGGWLDRARAQIGDAGSEGSIAEP